MFGGFLSLLLVGGAAVIFLRALFFTVTGQNVLEEGEDPIALGMPDDLMPIAIVFGVGLVLAFGRDYRSRWHGRICRLYDCIVARRGKR